MRAPVLPPPGRPRVDVLIVAGEHSGDEHAARMVREFLRLRPDGNVAAIGGPALAAAGAQLLYDLTGSSVVGIAEVAKHIGFFRRFFAATLGWIAEHRPRAVCLVDYPGMNLRLAAALRGRGLSRRGWGPIQMLYYISPQIWAWKAGRRFELARNVDAMAVIFPFEVAAYADTRLPVEFVGHPFAAPDFAPAVRFDPAGPVLLLPGSRRQAVRRIFPAILAGFREFGERGAVALFPSPEIEAELRRWAGSPDSGVTLRPVPRDAALGASAVLTSSGTMSMQCALAGIPGAIAYRANAATYVLGRCLVDVPYLGIANLLLGEAMYPEYLQGAAKAHALADQLRSALHDPERRTRAQAQAERLRTLLAGSARRTAGEWLSDRLGV
ncbi:MAG: lipid-A-disaccharide synthase [Opitutaceae bacterium]